MTEYDKTLEEIRQERLREDMRKAITEVLYRGGTQERVRSAAIILIERFLEGEDVPSILSLIRSFSLDTMVGGVANGIIEKDNWEFRCITGGEEMPYTTIRLSPSTVHATSSLPCESVNLYYGMPMRMTPVGMSLPITVMSECQLALERVVDGRNESLEVSLTLGDKSNLLVIGSEKGYVFPSGLAINAGDEMRHWIA